MLICNLTLTPDVATHGNSMITLIPRDWQPNPNVTGGGYPTQSLLIPRATWELAGRPTSIEEFYESQQRACTCKQRCPVHEV